MNKAEFPPEEQEDTFEDTREIYTDKKNIESRIEEVFEKATEAHPGKDLTLEDKEKIEKLKKEISVDNMIEKAIGAKDTGEEKFHQKESAKPVTGLKKLKVALAMMLGLGMGGQAVAQGGEKTVNSMKDAQEQVDLSKAVKVTTVPNDYTKLKTEGINTYYLKKTDGLETATSGVKGDPEKYMNSMITLVKNGTSPSELLEKHYIDEPAAKTLEQFYIPNKLDVVYTQIETELVRENPFAVYAEMGDIYYGPDGHAAAEIRFKTRNSQEITDAGAQNTQKSPVLIQFRDDFKTLGKPFLLPAEEMQNYFIASTTHFKSKEAYDALLQRGMNEQTIGTISTKDLANK